MSVYVTLGADLDRTLRVDTVQFNTNKGRLSDLFVQISLVYLPFHLFG